MIHAQGHVATSPRRHVATSEATTNAQAIPNFPWGTCGMRVDNAALHFSIDEYIKLFSHKNPLAEQRDS